MNCIKRMIDGHMTAVITIDGRFAINEVETMRKEMIDIYDNKIAYAQVDFSQCTFIDSTGLGLLVSIHKRCIEQDGKLVIANPSDVVTQLLKLTRLDHVFAIK